MLGTHGLLGNIAAALTKPNPRLAASLGTPCQSCLRQLSTAAEEEASAIEPPPSIVTATSEQLEQVMPISFELGELRRKTLLTRGVVVRHAVSPPPLPPTVATLLHILSWCNGLPPKVQRVLCMG